MIDNYDSIICKFFFGIDNEFSDGPSKSIFHKNETLYLKISIKIHHIKKIDLIKQRFQIQTFSKVCKIVNCLS